MTDTGPMNLTERLLGQLLAGTELFSVHLGIQLGLYRVLHEHPGATDTVLAKEAGIAERYAREWLEQQAAAGEIERLQYAYSVLHCLPATMAEDPVEAAGTVLRAPTVARWAAQAGFRCAVLPIEHDFWRFYRLSVLD